jgi:hypothetical protein
MVGLVMSKKECKTCGVSVAERPGKCDINWLAKPILGLKSPYDDYPCWQPKEEKSICDDCTKNAKCESFGSGIVKSCDFFEQKTCGSCGNHKKHYTMESGGNVAECKLRPGETLKECSWTPIKPVCDACGGTGKVCNPHCKHVDTKCKQSTCKYTWPCPACQKPEKELMVPVRWEESKFRSKLKFGKITITVSSFKNIRTKKEYWQITIWEVLVWQFLGLDPQATYDTRELAQTAVEKALGAVEK